MEKLNDTTRKKLRILFVSLTAFFLLIVYFVALTALPANPLSLKKSVSLQVMSVMPEGWAFFTRDAREEKVYTYKKVYAGNWERVNVSGSSLRYSFGLNRKGRSVSAEIALLLSQINEKDWVRSEMDIQKYFSLDTLQVHEIVDSAPEPLCTGEIIIQIIPPTPWAWAKYNVNMPYKIVRLHVTENKKKN